MENIDECPAIVAAACVLHHFCLLADGESNDEFLDEFNEDDGDDDCEITSLCSKTTSCCKEKPDGYLSQPLIHVISAQIVNYCTINSDKSSYTC